MYIRNIWSAESFGKVKIQDSAKLDKILEKFVVVIIDQLLPSLKYFFVFLLMILHWLNLHGVDFC